MEYLGEIIAFVVGAITGGITVRWQINRSMRNSVVQAGNTVGGDMAARDVHKS
jgi:hypothetical protein